LLSLAVAAFLGLAAGGLAVPVAASSPAAPSVSTYDRALALAAEGRADAALALLQAWQPDSAAGEEQKLWGQAVLLRRLGREAEALPLLLVAFGRAGAFMGHLAFLAPLYAARFDLSSSAFALVWSVSGGSFFVGHLLAGRILALDESGHRAHRVMAASLALSLLALVGVYVAPALPLALACTAALSASHAVVAAAVTTLLVRRCTDVRGPALSLNAAGMSMGLFLGTAAAGAGLGVAGQTGAAVVLVALTLLSLGAALVAAQETTRSTR